MIRFFICRIMTSVIKINVFRGFGGLNQGMGDFFYHRGTKSMAFKLFLNVKKCEVIPYLESTERLEFQTADIWVDLEKKYLVLETINRRYLIDFPDYDKLLVTIIGIGKELYFRDMLESLNRAKDYLTTYRRYPQLLMAEKGVTNLVTMIERVKEDLFNDNYTLMLNLGSIKIEDVDNFIKIHPETKRAIEDGIERFKILCWESEEDDGVEDCNRIIPSVYVDVYTIPEDKRIMFVINVDQIREVYEHVRRYDNAYDYLKALEGYKDIVMSHW